METPKITKEDRTNALIVGVGVTLKLGTPINTPAGKLRHIGLVGKRNLTKPTSLVTGVAIAAGVSLFAYSNWNEDSNNLHARQGTSPAVAQLATNPIDSNEMTGQKSSTDTNVTLVGLAVESSISHHEPKHSPLPSAQMPSVKPSNEGHTANKLHKPVTPVVTKEGQQAQAATSAEVEIVDFSNSPAEAAKDKKKSSDGSSSDAKLRKNDEPLATDSDAPKKAKKATEVDSADRKSVEVVKPIPKPKESSEQLQTASKKTSGLVSTDDDFMNDPRFAKPVNAAPKQLRADTNEYGGMPTKDEHVATNWRVEVVDVDPNSKYVLLTNPSTLLPQRFKAGERLPDGRLIQKIDGGMGSVQIGNKNFVMQ